MSKEHAHAIAAHSNPYDLAKAMVHLHAAHILEDYRDIIISNPKPADFAQILVSLKEANLLTEQNKNSLAGYLITEEFAYLIDHMKQAQCLNQVNFDCVLQLRHFNFLYHLSFLTHVNHNHGVSYFRDFFSPEHRALLNRDIGNIIWTSLTYTSIQQHWNEILIASRQPNPQAALTRLKNQILGIELPVNANPKHTHINETQSTHKASVHQSVSESATKLLARYGSALEGEKLGAIIQKIRQWCDSLPAGDEVHDAAKRCIIRLTGPLYTYVDPASNVSLQQIIALSWLAIHDDGLRQGSLADAKQQLCQGLYEIQRGGNLSEEGLDLLGFVDHSICTSGSFNKLVEKLQGIHPEVVVKYITHTTASLKLPIVIKEEVLRYLAESTHPTTAAEFLSITAPLQQIQEERSPAPIWKQIKARVAERLFAEFGSLYPLGQDDPLFISFIEAGIYLEIDDLPSFQKELSESTGYKAYLRDAMTSFGLFSRLHDVDPDLDVDPTLKPD